MRWPFQKKQTEEVRELPAGCVILPRGKADPAQVTEIFSDLIEEMPTEVEKRILRRAMERYAEVNKMGLAVVGEKPASVTDRSRR